MSLALSSFRSSLSLLILSSQAPCTEEAGTKVSGSSRPKFFIAIWSERKKNISLTTQKNPRKGWVGLNLVGARPCDKLVISSAYDWQADQNYMAGGVGEHSSKRREG